MATATSIDLTRRETAGDVFATELRTFHGPSGWSNLPTLEFRLTIDAWFDARRQTLNARLRPLGVELEGGERLDGAADGPARWFADAVIRLQAAGESDVSFRGWRAEGEGSWRVAVEFEEERTARAAVELLERWLRRAVERGSGASETSDEAADEWRRFLDSAYDARLGNTTRAIVRAAASRGIPFLRLDDESLVQLGQGCRQRRVETAMTDRTGAIANRVATDKRLAKRLLDAVGIPVPEGRDACDANGACRAAEALGWPVVVKPADADYGDGVSIRLTDMAAVRTAFEFARPWSDRVLVERFIPGTLYRLLVIDGRLVSAVRRESPFVVGDGVRTIGQLAEFANRDPRRPPTERAWLEQPATAEARWARHGEPDDEIPAAGKTVALRRDCFLRSGGFEVERVADVHPDFARLAIDAARVVGLDIAGLDVIASDLECSPWSQPCAVLEVNPQPALVLHRAPLCMPESRVCDAIVDSLFGANDTGRLPLVAVLGDQAADREARQIVNRWQQNGLSVGLACRTGAWLDGRRLGAPRDGHVSEALRRLWRHPRTEAVVVHVTPGDLVREGVPFDRCDELKEVGSVRTWLGALNGGETDFERVLERLRGTVRAAAGERISRRGAGDAGKSSASMLQSSQV